MARGMPGAGLTGATLGKALSDLPTFQPYWGNPTVRNDRGERGNIGMTGLRLAPTRANHPDPESCASGRKATGEALTGAHAGWVWSSEIMLTSRAPTSF